MTAKVLQLFDAMAKQRAADRAALNRARQMVLADIERHLRDLSYLTHDLSATKQAKLADLLADGGLTMEQFVSHLRGQKRFKLKTGGRLCSCGVARLMISEGTLPHKAGCPEAN